MCVVSDYGLFRQDDDPSKGKWLEPARALNFYPLKSGVSTQYKSPSKMETISHLVTYYTANISRENCAATANSPMWSTGTVCFCCQQQTFLFTYLRDEGCGRQIATTILLH